VPDPPLASVDDGQGGRVTILDAAGMHGDSTQNIENVVGPGGGGGRRGMGGQGCDMDMSIVMRMIILIII
jgi:hypothetical protein